MGLGRAEGWTSGMVGWPLDLPFCLLSFVGALERMVELAGTSSMMAIVRNSQFVRWITEGDQENVRQRGYIKSWIAVPGGLLSRR